MLTIDNEFWWGDRKLGVVYDKFVWLRDDIEDEVFESVSRWLVEKGYVVFRDDRTFQKAIEVHAGIIARFVEAVYDQFGDDEQEAADQVQRAIDRITAAAYEALAQRLEKEIE